MFFPRTTAVCLFGLLSALATAQTTIRRVTVFPAGNAVQVEISASAPVTPQSQVIANPDRLVLDFPNSIPGNDLHNISIHRGQIRGLRVSLFAANPPVTRVVVDLDAPLPYEIVPSGPNIVLKINSGETRVAKALPPVPTPASAPVASASPVSVPAPVAAVPPAPAPPRMTVDFKNGKLKIFSDRASLAEVLTEVRRRTGADIAIPPSASQEQVFGTLGPASPRDVMAALLNGSHFNFVVVGADNDPSQLRTVMLTPRDGAPVSVPAVETPQPSGIVDSQPVPADASAPPEEAPPPDENPNPDLAADPNPDNDAAPAEPDMSPRRHHRRGAAEQPEQPEPPQ